VEPGPRALSGPWSHLSALCILPSYSAGRDGTVTDGGRFAASCTWYFGTLVLGTSYGKALPCLVGRLGAFPGNDGGDGSKTDARAKAGNANNNNNK
jgi:hypothetical protein